MCGDAPKVSCLTVCEAPWRAPVPLLTCEGCRINRPTSGSQTTSTVYAACVVHAPPHTQCTMQVCRGVVAAGPPRDACPRHGQGRRGCLLLVPLPHCQTSPSSTSGGGLFYYMCMHLHMCMHMCMRMSLLLHVSFTTCTCIYDMYICTYACTFMHMSCVCTCAHVHVSTEREVSGLYLGVRIGSLGGTTPF